MDPVITPIKITGELASLLQLTVPLAVRFLRKNTRKERIKAIDKDLEEGSTLLMDCWSFIPAERQVDIERQFLM